MRIKSKKIMQKKTSVSEILPILIMNNITNLKLIICNNSFYFLLYSNYLIFIGNCDIEDVYKI